MRPSISLLLLLPLLALAMAGALTLGRYPLTPGDLGQYLLALCQLAPMDPERYGLLTNLIVNIRLPRILAAVLVGASLASSGAAFQAVFRNPLVSPGLLGVLAGAAFGAALGIVFSGQWWVAQVLSFLCGLLAVGVGLGVAHLFGRASLVMLVLGGVISSALFSSLLSLVKYLADPYNQLPTIVYWLMGSLAMADLHQVAWLAPPMVLAMGLLLLCGQALDALSMGDDEALALGVPVTAIRATVIFAATLISALTVSLAGIIGWVGLIIPHIARLMVGPGNARLLPVSTVLGAIFLLAADALSRSLNTTEIPIGIVTELLGIPCFLLVLHRVRRGWA